MQLLAVFLAEEAAQHIQHLFDTSEAAIKTICHFGKCFPTKSVIFVKFVTAVPQVFTFPIYVYQGCCAVLVPLWYAFLRSSFANRDYCGG